MALRNVFFGSGRRTTAPVLLAFGLTGLFTAGSCATEPLKTRKVCFGAPCPPPPSSTEGGEAGQGQARGGEHAVSGRSGGGTNGEGAVPQGATGGSGGASGQGAETSLGGNNEAGTGDSPGASGHGELGGTAGLGGGTGGAGRGGGGMGGKSGSSGMGGKSGSDAGGKAGTSTGGQATTCGDGTPQSGEDCDDGNPYYGDGCFLCEDTSECDECWKDEVNDPCVLVPPDYFFQRCSSTADVTLGGEVVAVGTGAGAKFAELCTELMTCVVENACTNSVGDMLPGCFCGDKAVSFCTDEEADGPCKDEILAASEVTVTGGFYNPVNARATDASFPLGVASNLLRCHIEGCADACSPL